MRRSTKPSSHRQFVAIIADIVGSRELPAARRKIVQRSLLNILTRLNNQYRTALAAKFKMTSGDEFESLLRIEHAGKTIPDIVWTLETRFAEPALRIGIGLGSVDTDLSEDASALDGPAFHHARTAVSQAAANKQLGGVFSGFGDEADPILNGIARLLRYQRSRWSEQQRNVAIQLRQGKLQTAAAAELGLTKQAVSAYARAAGWEAHVEGEAAWQTAIRQAIQAATHSKIRSSEEPV